MNVELLQDDVVVIRGLKPEWPPCVRLEPYSDRISVSFDGAEWKDASEQKDLWILRTLDPRSSWAVLQRTQPREQIQHGPVRRVRGTVSLSSLYRGAATKSLTRNAIRDEVTEAMLANGDKSYDIEINISDNKIVSVNQRFVLSDESITLKSTE